MASLTGLVTGANDDDIWKNCSLARSPAHWCSLDVDEGRVSDVVASTDSGIGSYQDWA
ncbi:hypothetical protein ACP70R_006052 [Stipagrostis hirtigluma subsp. patula]